MALHAIIGQARALDGREAGAQAARKATELIGRHPVVMAFVFASYTLPMQQVLSGATALLGDAPVIGFSTSAELVSTGVQSHSVVVALLSSNAVTSHAEWFSGFGDDSRTTTQRMLQVLGNELANSTLMIVADGFNGDAKDMCAALPSGNYKLIGCLAGGDARQARTYQAGGRQSGYGGVAAAVLNGEIVTGVGIGQGWESVGSFFTVTQTRGPWVRTLNDRPAAEIYAELFGYQPREWGFPPLNELVRLYPLGIERSAVDSLMIRSPLRMESDGSLRMHTLVTEGSTAHIMLGSSQGCLRAAKEAAQQALAALNGAKPVLALVFPDVAWQMLLKTMPGAEIQAVREVLGAEIPIAGGYSFGQITRSNLKNQRIGNPELYNQAIEVIVFGQPEE